MEEIDLRFEFEEGIDLDAVAQKIKERLQKVEGIEDAAVLPEEAQVTGPEVVAVVVATIAVLPQITKGVQELRKLMVEIKGLLGDLGIKRFVSSAGEETVTAEMKEDKPTG
jgi:hypothetical protein